jgi:hypothetical protein
MIPATCEGCPAVELEYAYFHPAPEDLGPIYSVELVDKRWTILMRRLDPPGFVQFYTPPDFLHDLGKTQFAMEEMCRDLNIGARGIDVVMAHEATYNPRIVGDAY